MIIIILIKHFHLDGILTSALQATVFKLMAMRLAGHELLLLKIVKMVQVLVTGKCCKLTT